MYGNDVHQRRCQGAREKIFGGIECDETKTVQAPQQSILYAKGYRCHTPQIQNSARTTELLSRRGTFFQPKYIFFDTPHPQIVRGAVIYDLTKTVDHISYIKIYATVS